jgi:hypothetical protein
MRSAARAALALGALAMGGALGACTGADAPRPQAAALQAAPQSGAPQSSAPKTSLVTAGLSSAEIYAKPSATAPIRQDQPQTAAAPPQAPDAPQRLVGLDRPALQAVLGSPALQRAEGKAELWQYRAAACVLDVFFYAGKDGQLRVTHADLRGRRDNRAPPQGCYADIAAGADRRAQTARN